MKITQVEISLADLQEALGTFVKQHLKDEPEVVVVTSHGKRKITVHLEDCGLVTCEEFAHRAPSRKELG